MPQGAFACPYCNSTIEVAEGLLEMGVTCPSCASRLEAFLFPALFRPAESGMTAAALVDTSEASCFYHPQKQAARVCDGCGRLICSLCSIDMGSEHLCPACVSAGRKKEKFTGLESGRTRYDNVALGLGIASLVMSIFALILSPATVYIVIRHWKSPGGLEGRGHVRMIIGLVIAIFAFVFWGSTFGLGIWGATHENTHSTSP
jgi:hypothetical protein